MSKRKSIILIPVYQPKVELVSFLHNLKQVSKSDIVVVDDGSGDGFESIFEVIKKNKISVIEYSKNQGKGFAIKKGIKFVLENYPAGTGIITADGDGQHTTEDIKKIADELEIKHDSKLIILGSREFDKKTTPKKSYIGNRATSFATKLATGINIPDTQTGLRGFTPKILSDLLKIKGNRYEYEMNVLLEAKDYGIGFEFIPIKTIYDNNNSGSHFHPIRDSLLVYRKFLKFVASSVISSGIDFGVFTFLIYLFNTNGQNQAHNIFIASIISRSIAGVVNFLINYYWVFANQKKQTLKSLSGYFVLWLIQALISTTVVSVIGSITNHPIYMKLIVDIAIFFISYFIQRHFIFNKKTKEEV